MTIPILDPVKQKELVNGVSDTTYIDDSYHIQITSA